MHITVLGAGAIGGTLAAGLKRAGAEVAIVDRDADHIEEVRRSGLRITGYGGEFSVRLPALHPAEARGPLEAVLLAVKSPDTPGALGYLAPLLGPASFVVSFQNGVNAPRIAERIGAERTLSAMISLSADYHGPGHVHRGSEGKIFVGELDGRITPRVETLARLLSFDAHTAASPSANILGHNWAKLCQTCLDVTFALSDMDKEDVLAEPAFYPAVTGVVRETARVAAAAGVRLEPYGGLDPGVFLLGGEEGARRVRAFMDAFHAKARASLKKRPGTWRDIVVRKRKTAVDFTVGHVEDEARRLGLAAPLNAAVRRWIHEVEEGARALGPHNIHALAALAAEGATAA